MSLELLAIDAKLVCMEVFVSGQIDDIDNVRIVQDAFTEAGHHITLVAPQTTFKELSIVMYILSVPTMSVRAKVCM
jgi:hypothetical protein